MAALVCGFLIACGQNPASQKTTSKNELLEQELKNQERARTGNPNPSIEIITDAQQVEQLRSTIVANIKKAQAAAATTNRKDLAQRYKKGDHAVVPAIIAVLQGNDLARKKDLYFDLGRNYDDNGYRISDPALITQILSGIDKPQEEKEAVQLAGLNELPGYHEKMEARLLSGKSGDVGRTFYWISDKGKLTPGINYVLDLVRQNKLKQDDLNSVISGLEKLAENGDDAVRKTVGDVGLLIYERKQIEQDEFEELKSTVASSGSAETILKILFDYGDKRVIPVAYDILKKKIRTTGPIVALIRLEGPQHLEKVTAFLKDPDTYYDGLNIVESLEARYVDDKLLQEVINGFAQQPTKQDYVADRLVRDFIRLNAVKYIANIQQYTSDKKVVNLITKAYSQQITMQQKTSLYGVLTDLLASGLINKKPSPETVERLQKEAEGSVLSFAYSMMELSQSYLSFDTETDMLPVDFDKLLNQFAATSQGVLSDMLVWMDAKESGDKFDYKVTVVYKDKAFIARPAFMDDWYDMQTVEEMLKALLEQSGSPKRFVGVTTGDQTAQYIFGEPEKVQAFLKKYE